MSRRQAAGLLDESTVAGIRAYEVAEERPRGHQWQVLAALILDAFSGYRGGRGSDKWGERTDVYSTGSVGWKVYSDAI